MSSAGSATQQRCLAGNFKFNATGYVQEFLVYISPITLCRILLVADQK